ncbi:MAG: GGDEF domain-containing protein [Clostridiales Family XIII bacterium]|jgi:diguanylate cyclase (GGDEF)-like protein|nr:GGDEF domain-containing protein [Clostridiales Family XIII bacterium]
MFGLSIADLPLHEAISIISSEIRKIFADFPLVNFLVPALLGLGAFYYLGRSIYGRVKLSLENKAFIVYCAAAFVLTGLTALSAQFAPFAQNKVLTVIGALLFYSLPSVFCLHIWSQVSQKKVLPKIFVLYFIVPLFVTGFFAYLLFSGQTEMGIWDLFVMRPMSYHIMLYAIYWVCITMKSFRLCLNVFYQMPRHMQGSTMPLIAALFATTAVYVFLLVVNTRSAFLLYHIMLFIVMNRAYSGFFRASAANVIATSRQFVNSNLGTQILILSKKGYILEWNTPQDHYLISAVRPKYLQPYEKYRELLLEAGSGIVSPHDPNVLTLTFDGREHDILIHRNPIAEGKKVFGELIEIADVTNLYSVLHQMETISFIDQMTGLRNRNAYLTMARGIMKPENMPLLIVIGDVNNLKLVNDKLGHVVGDRMLADVARILKESAPEDAFIARIGGDEFVLLLPNTDESVAEAFHDKVNALCIEMDDEEYGRPSISIGWASAQYSAADYNSVFEEADAWMYKRKKAYKEQTQSGRFLTGMLFGMDDTTPQAAPPAPPAPQTQPPKMPGSA